MVKKIFMGMGILSLSACSFFTQSDITTITSIQQAKSVFESATPQDLFVFDMDETIIEPTDPLAQGKYYQSIKTQLKSDPIKKIRDDAKAYFAAKNDPDFIPRKAFMKLAIQPVEQGMINYILNLQKRSIKVIALTRCSTGPEKEIEKVEHIRYQELLKVGLDFSASFGIEEMIFDELHDEKNTTMHPTYYKGIVATTQIPKGIVLAAFLKKVNFIPTHIYFFDDREEQCKSVVDEMKKLGIPCTAFHYIATITQQEPFQINIDVFKLQFELMKQHNDYISYPEAEKIFNAQKQITTPHGAQPTMQ